MTVSYMQLHVIAVFRSKTHRLHGGHRVEDLVNGWNAGWRQGGGWLEAGMTLRALTQSIFVWALLWAPVAQAHPHEFVDVGLELRFDPAGQLVSVGVSWHYDELTSLMILSDIGIFPAGDAPLSDSERARLMGFDTQWVEGYEGDLRLEHAGQTVALTGPLNPVVDYADGQVISRFERRLETPLLPGADALLIKAYDPEFYVYYTLLALPEVQGRSDCRISVRQADLEAARAVQEAELAQLDPALIEEEGQYPRIGWAFADEVALDCAG